MEKEETLTAAGRGANYRLGRGLREDGPFLEAIIQLFPAGTVDLEHLRRALDGLARMAGQGFRFTYEGNGSLIGELAVRAEEADDAIRAALAALERMEAR